METVYVLIQKIVGFHDEVIIGVFKSEQAALNYGETIMSQLDENEAAVITQTVVRTILY